MRGNILRHVETPNFSNIGFLFVYWKIGLLEKKSSVKKDFS